MSPERGAHVVPLEARVRHLQNWDAAPKGFELISGDKAKLLGIFPPPGNVAKLTSFVPPPLDPALAAMVALLSGGESEIPGASLLKAQRRLYIAGFPPEARDEEIGRFLNNLMGGYEAVTNVNVSNDRTYAFVDVKTPEDATALIGKDGGLWRDNVNVIRIRRPKEYSENAGLQDLQGNVLGSITSFMAESNMIALVNLPACLQEAHVRALLEPFGDLRSCHLLTVPSTGESMGVAVFEFVHKTLAQPVCDALNGLLMGSQALALRPVIDVNEDEPELLFILSAFNLAPQSALGSPTTVIQLLNAVSDEELADETELQAILEDIQAEAQSYGTVTSIQIPRPVQGKVQSGVGKVFIEFASAEEAQLAQEAISGRTFADRTVLAFFYSPDRFRAHIY